jgi:cell division protein FtsB
MLEKVKTWFRRLRYYTKKDILTFNNIVLFFAVVLCLVWTYGAINSMSRNLQLEEKLKTRQLEAAKLKLEVETLKLEQDYFQTDEYKELMARIKLNRMQPGETMVVLPKNSESAINKYANTKTEMKQERSNFAEWLDFLFG